MKSGEVRRRELQPLDSELDVDCGQTSQLFFSLEHFGKVGNLRVSSPG